MGPGPGGRVQGQAGSARIFDRLRYVYTTFRIPAKWNWKAGNGENGTRHNANPLIDSDARIQASAEAAPIRSWGHRIARHVPLLDEQQAKAGSEEQPEPEYRQAYVLIKNDKDEWVPVDRSEDADGVAGHVVPLDKSFGFRVEMHPAHLLAKNHFAGAAAGKTNQQPKYDYRTIIATVAARLDQRIAVTVDVPLVTTGRTRYIDVPDAETWWVVEGTVLEVGKGGKLHRQPKGGTVRDDADRLAEVATLAKAWYSRPRSTVSFTVNDLIAGYGVGVYVTSAATDANQIPFDVNSVMTQVVFDCQRIDDQLPDQLRRAGLRRRRLAPPRTRCPERPRAPTNARPARKEPTSHPSALALDGVWSIEPSAYERIVAALQGALRPRPRPGPGSAARGSTGPTTRDGRLAIIQVAGPLTKTRGFIQDYFGGYSSGEIEAAVDDASDDPDVGGILLRIESPGGQVAGIPEAAAAVARAAAKKPVVAYCEDLCCSAAYWIASQASSVIANASAIVGSIGTYIALTDLSA